MDSNVILIRALKTFIQAALAVMAAGIIDVSDLSTLKALAIGGIAAGVSAVMNLFLQPTEAK